MESKRTKHTIDVSGKSVGRMATQIAHLLMGKNHPSFVSHIDGGDFVEVIHVDQLRISAGKAASTFHTHHTGHPGGLRRTSVQSILKTNPRRLIEHAVSKMLPRNRFRSGRMRRLTFLK